jgi:DNA-binding transcriptional regulator PaaX
MGDILKYMANPFTEITKNILFGLFESGKYILTGDAPLAGITKWRVRIPYPGYIKDKEEKKKFSQALWRLKNSCLIIQKEKAGGKFIVELTEKGKRKIQEIKLADLRIQKLLDWDKIWRIVIFDIPEKKKFARNILREKLKKWDFFQLQKSVWVCPWPCEKEIEFIIELFGVASYVNIVKAGEIKKDAYLRQYFHLL